MELVEREEILAELNRLRAEASTGSGVLVLLGGEAGVGKSAVCQRLFQDSSASGRFLTGYCDPLRTPRPLGPVIDIGETVGGALRYELRMEPPRDRVFEQFLDMLKKKPAPTVAVIEDVHWADEATLDLLRYLAIFVGSLVFTRRNLR